MTNFATEKTPLLNGCVVINIPTKEKVESLPVSDGLTKGLSLEELMPFDNDPWWQNLRRIMMITFWVAVVVIFIVACIIAVDEHGQGYCQARNNGTRKLITPETNVTLDQVMETATAAAIALAL